MTPDRLLPSLRRRMVWIAVVVLVYTLAWRWLPYQVSALTSSALSGLAQPWLGWWRAAESENAGGASIAALLVGLALNFTLLLLVVRRSRRRRARTP